MTFECLLIDINECEIEAHNCDHLCLNTIGSFHCACQSGYILNTLNNRTCNGKFNYFFKKLCNFLIKKDINECSEGISGCSQLCINTIGSYSCSCQFGYQLDSDSYTCLGKDILALYYYHNKNQILMSVLLRMEDVNRIVRIVMVLILVLV